MKAAVIGAGSWGSALAIHLARVGCEVRLWAFEADVVAAIGETRRNPLFLTEAEFPAGVEATGSLERACEDAEVAVLVVPVQFARSVLARLKGVLGDGVPLVSASKGIEVSSLERVDEIAEELLQVGRGRFVALSGPSFAHEVAAGLPTAAVLAGWDEAVVARLQEGFSSASFRFYGSDDVVGVELAGALKNVVAIAAGMATGLDLGHNALAALMTRGLHEIARLGVRLGGREETFRGLAGMGDLVLTCTGALSRNRRVGERLGRGEGLDAVLSGREVAEGVPTARAAARLARRLGVDMPVTFAVDSILAGHLSPREAVEALMTRQLMREAEL